MLGQNDQVDTFRATHARLVFLDSIVIDHASDETEAERGRMPHLKCEPCGMRLYTAGSGDQVGDLCPGCGSLLEPVGELAELVGFRLIRFAGAADGAASSSHQRVADQLGDLMLRRQAAYAEARLD